MKKIYLSFLSVFCLGIYAQVNLNSGLTGYFPLNGNYNDLSSSSINATNNGTAFTTGYQGISNTAANFIAVQSNYITAGTNDRGVVDQMTICFWFRTTGTGNYALAEKYDWSQDAGFYIRINNGQIFFHGRDQSGVGHAPGGSVSTYNDGNWHFLVAMVDVNHWKLYVDCEEIQDYVTTTVNPDISVNAPLTFGRYNLGASNYLQGDMDEIRFYDRPLTQDEICYLCGMNTLNNQLTGLFLFNGNTNDGSSTGVNATNFGASLTTGHDGISNSAYSFVAVQSDYMTAGTTNRGVTDEMTISLWFRTSGTGNYVLAEKYDWGQDAGFYIRINNGQIFFHGRDQSGVGHAPAGSVSTYNDGNWHNLIAIVNVNHWIVYVDCKPIQDYVTTTANPDISVNAPLTFGRYDLGASNYLDGDLDEIRFYSRAMLLSELCVLCKQDSDSVFPRRVFYDPLKLNVFPNPFNSTVQLTGAEHLTDYTIFISTITGQRIRIFKNQQVIDMSDLSSGIYIIEIYNEAGKLYSQKLIKTNR